MSEPKPVRAWALVARGYLTGKDHIILRSVRDINDDNVGWWVRVMWKYPLPGWRIIPVEIRPLSEDKP